MNSFGFEAAAFIPYYFISYSHSAADRIRPIAVALNASSSGRKIPLWYDEGIDKRTEWDKTLRNKIRDCSLFLLFFDESMITRGEASFAYEEFRYLTETCKRSEHQILPIFLDPITEEMKKENSWAKTISDLQGIETQGKTPEQIAEEIRSSIEQITKDDILDWISHMKYSCTRIHDDILPFFRDPDDKSFCVSEICEKLIKGTLRRISITGEGGAGKTSAIKKICSVYSESDNACVLFIPIKECKEGIFRYLHQRADAVLKRTTVEKTFKKALLSMVSEKQSDERILIVFDGINETASGIVEKEIRSILRKAKSHVSFLVSSRLDPDYEIYESFCRYSAQRLSREQIRKYLRGSTPGEDSSIWPSLSNPQILWMFKKVSGEGNVNQLQDASDVMNQYFESLKKKELQEKKFTALEGFVYEYLFPELVCRYDYAKLISEAPYDENMILKGSYIREHAEDVINLFKDDAESRYDQIYKGYNQLNPDSLYDIIYKIYRQLTIGKKDRDSLIWAHENYRDFFIAKGMARRKELQHTQESSLWDEYLIAMHERQRNFSNDNSDRENEFIYSQIRKQEFLFGLMNNAGRITDLEDQNYAFMLSDLIKTLNSNDYYWKIEPVVGETVHRLLRLLSDPVQENRFTIASVCQFTGYCASRSFPAKKLDKKVIWKETEIGKSALLPCKEYVEAIPCPSFPEEELYGKILSNLGACYLERYQSTEKEADIIQAIDYHSDCLEHRTQLKAKYPKEERKVELSIATTLNNLASDYYQWGKYEEAVRIHSEVLRRRRELNSGVRGSETNLCGALLKLCRKAPELQDLEILTAIRSVMPEEVRTEGEDFSAMVIDFALYQFNADICELRTNLKNSHPNIKRLIYLPDDYKDLYAIYEEKKIQDPGRIENLRNIYKEIRRIGRDLSRNIEIEEFKSI